MAPKIPLSEAIKIAVENNDIKRCGRIADQLRFKGMNYHGVLAFAQKHTGISAGAWENMMYTLDTGME